MIPLRDANPTRRRPVVTIGVIAVCIAVFGLEMAVRVTAGEGGLARLFGEYGLVPAFLTSQLGGGSPDELPRALATLVSSMFLHGDVFHIGFNLLFLWIFGNNVEDRLGHVGFVGFYLAGGFVAAAAQVAADPGSTVPVIGASGAIAAVLGAYVVLWPRARVLSLVYFGLFFQVLQVPAVVLLGIWFLVQIGGALMSTGSSGGGVALFAHIGGFVAGAALGLIIRTVGAGGRPRPLHSTDRVGVG